MQSRQDAVLRRVERKPHGSGKAGRRLALVTLCLAVLIAQLDSSVVNLAVAPIGQHFGASVAALQWTIDGYNLAYAVLLLSGGLIADLYGRRFAFMAGAVVFVIGSLGCAVAPSVSVLVAGRVVAGIGAALLLPSSLALVAVVWPDPAERRHAIGIWSACNGLAFVIGPTLGGLLIEHAGWRSIFVVVIPIGMAAVALALAVLPESADPRGRAFDAPAQVLGALILGGLALAAIEAEDVPWLALAAAALACVSLPLFWIIERRRGDAALVPLDLFRIRPFRGAILATAAMTFGMYGMLFLLPMSWQSAGLLSAVGAGLALVPMAAIFALVSPILRHSHQHIQLARDNEWWRRPDRLRALRSRRRRRCAQRPSCHHRLVPHRPRHGRRDRPAVRRCRRLGSAGARRNGSRANQRRAHGGRHDRRRDVRQRLRAGRRRHGGLTCRARDRRRRATRRRRHGLDRGPRAAFVLAAVTTDSRDGSSH
jgi:MFS family permease